MTNEECLKIIDVFNVDPSNTKITAIQHSECMNQIYPPNNEIYFDIIAVCVLLFIAALTFIQMSLSLDK